MGVANSFTVYKTKRSPLSASNNKIDFQLNRVIYPIFIASRDREALVQVLPLLQKTICLLEKASLKLRVTYGN